VKITLNNQVACTPFPKAGIEEAKTATGVSFIANTVKLTPLKVVYGNSDVPAGSVAYVSGKDYTSQWAKSVYKLGEDTIILVPLSSIVVLEVPDADLSGR